MLIGDHKFAAEDRVGARVGTAAITSGKFSAIERPRRDRSSVSYPLLRTNA